MTLVGADWPCALSGREPDRVPYFLPLTMHGAQEMGVGLRRVLLIRRAGGPGPAPAAGRYGSDVLYPFFYGALEFEAFGGEVEHFDDGPPNAVGPLALGPRRDRGDRGTDGRRQRRPRPGAGRDRDPRPVRGPSGPDRRSWSCRRSRCPCSSSGSTSTSSCSTSSRRSQRACRRSTRRSPSNGPGPNGPRGPTRSSYFDPLASPEILPIGMVRERALPALRRTLDGGRPSRAS